MTISVSIHWDTVGIEIKRAICRKRNINAAEYNLKQARKYKKYAATTRSSEMTAIADSDVEDAIQRLRHVVAISEQNSIVSESVPSVDPS